MLRSTSDVAEHSQDLACDNFNEQTVVGGKTWHHTQQGYCASRRLESRHAPTRILGGGDEGLRAPAVPVEWNKMRLAVGALF